MKPGVYRMGHKHICIIGHEDKGHEKHYTFTYLCSFEELHKGLMLFSEPHTER